MDAYIFLRESDSAFKWVAAPALDRSRCVLFEPIKLTIRNSKYSLYSQSIYIASYVGKIDPKRKAPRVGSIIGLYKSALQKSVRRKLADRAMELTARIWDASPFELVRRLMIIMCEDVFITTDYIWLSWLLAAISKKYIPDVGDFERVLKLVEKLCKCDYRDIKINYSPPEGSMKAQRALNINDPEHASFCGSEKSDMLKAILVRMGYGGMACDTRMLERNYDLWWERFNKGCDPFTFTLPTAALTREPMDNPVLLEAVDHHCSSICDWVAAQTDFTVEQVKSLVWVYRSNINYRKYIWRVGVDGMTLEPDELYQKRMDRSDPNYTQLMPLLEEYSLNFLKKS